MEPIKNFHEIFVNEDAAINHLIQKEVLKAPSVCPHCGNAKLSLLENRKLRCTKKCCRKVVGIYEKTFFNCTKLAISSILELAYYWLAGVKSKPGTLPKQ
ncbi:hypothetical protein HZS_4441 [Henneguya salminicola]|nr:hypothetical protein HZS_4441 [Henneguya salminicola]